MSSTSSLASSKATENFSGLQALFHSTLGCVSLPVMALTSNGTITVVNNHFTSIFSITPGALQGSIRKNTLTFRSVKPFTEDGLPGMEKPDFKARIRIQGSKEFMVGFSLKRIWMGSCRIAIISFQKLDDIFAERRKLKNLQENLALKVRLRTIALANRVRELDAAKDKLSKTLKDLQATQSSLLNAEKMAALGRLVAGVAHEVNTPLGIGVTASSHLSESLQSLTNAYNEGKVTQRIMEDFLKDSDEAVRIIMNNLVRGAELVRSFKKVAVDQNNEDARLINMNDYIEDILLSLRPQIKQTKHTVTVKCDTSLQVKTYPGILSQLITNLITNSLSHAFSDEDVGEMHVEVTVTANNELHLSYHDSGQGIPDNMIEKVFEPFVTSKRGHGGTGLGLHIVHNLVTQKLGGTVQCTSNAGEGAHFEIYWPQHASLQNEQKDGPH